MSSDFRKSIADIFQKFYPKALGVYLFGSQVSSSTLTDSDVDLAILIIEELDPEEIFKLKAELSAVLKRNVDLVDLYRCDTVTAAQVVSTGELLVSNDASGCAFFENTAMSKYALLNEDRAGILEDIKKRGQIYG